MNKGMRKWLCNAGRWARVSTKVNGETRERLGQSAKRSAAVRGQAGRGATVAGRRLRVRPSRTPGFSACQVLWLIPGRCASCAAVCRASSFVCATQERESRRFCRQE
ncbi:unnamed protein product [Sphagnum jensenii]|uniref:Uncharacterized protein n=1 Tax=Sphagnum jensenii TaxID=128206 RepID=A0ABP0X6X9_9BRYO